MNVQPLAPPEFFREDRAGEVWFVPYDGRFRDALNFRRKHGIREAATDQHRVALLLIDVQNTFCLPSGELFVSGASGQGAVEDNRRLARFIYAHLPRITEIICTFDTHQLIQIFHPIFWLNGAGDHPVGGQTIITADEVAGGLWKVNPGIARDEAHLHELQRYARYYTQQLERGGKYPLMIWPHHAMLGGIGHALVPLIEEAVFFHGVVRQTTALMEMKGFEPLTENYSVLGPEVAEDAAGKAVGIRNTALAAHLFGFDAVFVAGQAKSHCVAWTVDDLLAMLVVQDQTLARKFHLLEDCTSPVVIPGVIDFSEAAETAYNKFARAGMHRVKSTDPWPF